jgi:hypothetical protein
VEVAAVAVQQAMLQQSLSIAMLKQAKEVEQALIEMVVAAASGRGQSLDISV